MEYITQQLHDMGNLGAEPDNPGADLGAGPSNPGTGPGNPVANPGKVGANPGNPGVEQLYHPPRCVTADLPVPDRWVWVGVCVCV